MKKLLIMSLFVAVISGCSSLKSNPNPDSITLNGKIEKLGMSTFQYGTHLLKSENKTYALKSATVNLDAYLNKQVKLKGTKILGYPLDGGPEFINVEEIKVP